MVTRDNRFKLVDGYNLQIANVRIQDAGELAFDRREGVEGTHVFPITGDYVCQIGDSEEARDQVHTVEILVPPSVRPVPQNGQITARKGSTVTLECRASGNPVPNIYFYKKVSFELCHFVTYNSINYCLHDDDDVDPLAKLNYKHLVTCKKTIKNSIFHFFVAAFNLKLTMLAT